MLQDRITNISEYFRSIQMEGDLFIIHVKYKNGWTAFNSSDDKIKVVKDQTEKNAWYYYANMSQVDIDWIFNLIDETIEFNENIIKKVTLLKQKVSELKEIFDKEPLSKLETLEFTFTEPKKRKKQKKNPQSVDSVINDKSNENMIESTTNDDKIIDTDKIIEEC